jgi:hypothetical protein
MGFLRGYREICVAKLDMQTVIKSAMVYGVC